METHAILGIQPTRENDAGDRTPDYTNLITFDTQSALPRPYG